MSRLVLLVPLLAAACGRAPDFHVQGAAVFVETDAPFARQPDLAGRLESTVSAALAYWGGGWEALRGRTITLLRGPYVPCAGSERAVGCYDGDVIVSTTDPGTGIRRCVEQTVLVHEIGHAVLGDRMHEDARWARFEPVGEALSGRAGYAADGVVDCPIALSVWRHPLGRP